MINLDKVTELIYEYNSWFHSDDYNYSKSKAMMELKLELIEEILKGDINNDK